MKNKFHAISMCSLIAAFATSSWAAAVSSCPKGFTEGDGKTGEVGVCYYDMPETDGATTITIPADLNTFKVRYQGKIKFTHQLNIHCEQQALATTVSVTNAEADLAAGSLSIRNRINIIALVDMTDANVATNAVTAAAFLDNYQSKLNMYNCKGTCKASSFTKKITGFNALSIIFSSTSDGEQGNAFELTVNQEPYQFGSMQVYNVNGLDAEDMDNINSYAPLLIMFTDEAIMQYGPTYFPDVDPKMLVAAKYAIAPIWDSLSPILQSILSILTNGKGSMAWLEGASTNGLTGLTFNIPADSVYFNREFAVSGSGLYSTLTLPFSISKAKIKNVSNVYEFKNIEGNKARFTSADKLDAYTPYLIELVDKATGIEFLEGVTLESSEDVSTDVRKDNWVFRGTLNYKKWDKSIDADKAVLEGCGTSSEPKSCAYGYAASGTYQGQFVRIGNGAYIFPFRAYLVYEEPKATKLAPANASYVLRPTVDIPDELELVVDGDNGQTTSIGRFDTRTGEIHINNMKHTYDLKGRRVNGTNNARGAYYGKKVLMK